MNAITFFEDNKQNIYCMDGFYIRIMKEQMRYKMNIRKKMFTSLESQNKLEFVEKHTLNWKFVKIDGPVFT